MSAPMAANAVLDREFLKTRAKILEIGALLDRIDRDTGWDLFCDALESDIDDKQQGTTPEGIHLGAMAGTVDIVLRHYAGIDTTREYISFFPRLPNQLRRLAFRVQFQTREEGQTTRCGPEVASK